ncbi:helix-turn-helix transcriptional regulator [Chryseobacterium gambrini]|uniref:helix-turn-helix transcriptional regulator n=1 Tax=Chryseobacterium gambrini TaxID=373672 RepID=UPI0022F3F5C8|nr:helix-turn-helix domain-containing protein [Chryseobacterium gambrini]WBX96042.1 helix-turn-helix domain-containing protein [Chryseobacterium gambrini]
MHTKHNELLTLNELETILKKKRTTIYKWRKEGKLIPYGMSGKSPLFRMEDIEKFLTESLKIQ